MDTRQAGRRRDSDHGEDATEGRALLADLEQTAIDQPRSWGLRALAWALGLAVVGVAAYTGWQLWLAWQTGYEPYWQHVGLAGPILVFLALAYVLSSVIERFLLGLRALARRIRSETERVRQAAITGDDRLAPLAAEQPEPLPSVKLPLGPTTFGPFETGRRKASRRYLVTQGATVVLAGGMIALFVVLGAISPASSDGPFGGMLGPFFVVLVGISALIGLMSLMSLALTAWRRVRGKGQDVAERVVVDDWSLQQAGDSRHSASQPLAWHEARAFYKADDLLRLNGSLVSQGPTQRTTYTVEAGERRLSWSVGTASSPAQRAESEQLARLIVTRTRLSLRDLSAAATTQAVAMLDFFVPFISPLLGKRLALQTAPAASGSAASRPAVRPVGTPVSRWTRISGIAAVVLAMLLLGVGALAQMIQSSQYDDLMYQHIDRETPYYTIDFREDDGRWPEHPATAAAGSFTFFTDGYHLTGAPVGQPMEALLSDSYGDATLELGAGLAGATQPGDYGMVLHETDDGAAKVVFSVASSGGWALTSYQTDASGLARRAVLMSNDHSSAVQTGRNAYNYMAVIMRGGDYLCFVRGHLVGIYHDRSGQTPHTGHSGIWLGNSRAVGIYYSFSIYPAQ